MVKNVPPLHVLCYTGNAEGVVALVQAGGDIEAVNKEGQAPLYAAARYDRVECVRRLVELGANTRAEIPGEGNKLLQYGSNGEVARILLEYGADPSLRPEKRQKQEGSASSSV